jgi:predicted DsbA family dithiol-disulfide isomerase
MPIPVDAWADFTCPFCFLSDVSLQKLQDEIDLDVHHRAFLLHPPEAQVLPPETLATMEREQQSAAARAKFEFDIDLRPGPIGISTQSAHTAAKFADSRKMGGLYHRAMMRAYWLEGKSIDNPSVLIAIGENVGLGSAELSAALENPVFAQAVEADRAEARRRGIRGVPLLLFGGKYSVSGAQPYAMLKQAALKAG